MLYRQTSQGATSECVLPCDRFPRREQIADHTSHTRRRDGNVASRRHGLGRRVPSHDGLGVTRTTEKGTDVAELHPELAKAKAQSALQFLAAFDGEDFGFMGEDKPGPHDRRHLAIALDHIQELGAMVLNLADRVTPNVELCPGDDNGE